MDVGNHRVRGAYDSTRTGSSHLERARKRYWDDDGHRTEQDRIADRVWDVLDKYNTIEEDEHGFTTLAGVAILNTIQGARTTRKVLETLTATQGAQPSTGMK